MNKTKNKLIPILRFPEFLKKSEWDEKVISAISSSESSSMALNKLELKQSGYPVYGADSIVGYIDEYQQEEKYISIVKDGSGVGRLSMCESYSSILGTLACIKSKDKKQYDLVWIYYLFGTVDFSVFVKGSGIPHIYFSDFKQEVIAVPKLKEQQKIASCLSSLDDVIAVHTEKLQLLKDHKKGLMQNLFPQAGEKVPKYRFQKFKKDKAWVQKKLGEVAEIGRGKSKHRPRNAAFLFGGKYPFIQTGDIRKADLYLTEYFQTYSEEGLKQSKLWNEGTLCITIAANIAETAILKIKACFPDSVIGLVSKKDKADILFIKYLFEVFKSQIQSFSQGMAQDNLNQEKLSKIEFQFPLLPEQQKIASCLSSLDELITSQREKIEYLKKHKKGLMQGLYPRVTN